jgi:hypothetical protein
VQRPRPYSQSSGFVAGFARSRTLVDAGAHALHRFDESCTRGIETHFGERQLAFAGEGRESDEERGGGGISRHVNHHGCETSRRTETNLVAITLDIDAHRPQHSLGMIPGARGFDHAHFHAGNESGETGDDDGFVGSP